MQKILVIFVAALVWADSFAYTQRNVLQSRIDSVSLRKCLSPGQSWVPYPDYGDRAGWDSLTGKYREDIVRGGEACLDYEWKVVKAMDYIDFEVSGDRSRMESAYDANQKALSALLAAELAEGAGRFIPQIVNGIYCFCDMTSWAVSAHLATLTPQRRSLPQKGDNTLELTQGGLSQLLCWTEYFLKDEFDRIQPEINRRLRAELKYRELDSYLVRNDFWWMGFDLKPGTILNNWNPWCNSNALLCFMLLEDDGDRLFEGVWKTIRSVDMYLNFIQGDGAIEEGPTYWAHATGKLFDYVYCLNLLTGEKFGLLDDPFIRNMGEFIVKSYAGNGWVANFADASPKENCGSSLLIYRFGKAAGSGQMTGYAAWQYARKRPVIAPGVGFFSFLEALRNVGELDGVKASYELPSYTWYPETQFHFERASDRMFLAAKGGNNGESHNHNDVGSFILYVDGEPLIMDVGVGTYTRQTFSAERYSIWTMQSSFHNLPLINGVAQKNGGKYRARDVYSSKGMFRADISGAYPEAAAVRKWVRSYAMKGNTLRITDEFKLQEAVSPNEIVFMTARKPLMAKNGVIGFEGAAPTLVFSDRVFAVETDTIQVEDPKIAANWGERIYRLRLVARKKVKEGKYAYSININN